MNDKVQELNLLISDITGQKITATEREQKTKTAIGIASTLEKEFMTTILSLQNKHAVSDSISLFVKTLHIWLEKLYLSPSSKSNLTELAFQCSETIHFIRRHFPESFDQQGHMALYLWQPIQEKLDQQWQTFEELHPSHTSLINLLRDIYQQQLKQKGRLSYYHADYWIELLSELCMIETATAAVSDDVLITTLIKHNFNDESFTYFFIENASNKIDGSIPQTTYWEEIRIFVEHIPPLNHSGLEQPLLHCKIQLKEAIEKQQTLCKAAKNITQPSIQTEFQFHTTLSVSQLGAFFRLLVDSGILLSTNHKELIRTVSQVFKTNRTTAPISEKHLYDTFYSLETHALNILKTRLMEMIEKTKVRG